MRLQLYQSYSLTAIRFNLANDKSPGSDGLSTNFYKFFWPDINDLLIDSYNYTFESKGLSQEQKLAVINLIPKKDKDLRYLKNWRPVSLLNTDYKILAKALANRLQKVIGHLICEDQVGYIKGRYIGEAIRTIEDIILLTKEQNTPGFITLIDFEKAFDSIEWPFLFKCLEKFNFGPVFTSWIRILYTNIKSCVGNNGYYSEMFEISRSIRQGCPLSALLFILVAEILAISIRETKKIKGIKFQNYEFKIAQLADDTTLFLQDLRSVSESISLFNDFTTISGLRLNLEKTEIIPIGFNLQKNIKLPNELDKLKYTEDAFKTMGIWFSNDPQKCKLLNFEDKIKKIEQLVNIWSTRNLSLKGKVTILKSLIVSQFSFLFSTIYTPVEILHKIDKIIFSFLWNNKPAKVKRSTIVSSIRNGGLKMPDIYSINETSKILWIKKISNNVNCKWASLMLSLLNLNPIELRHKLNYNFIEKGKSSFHKQILESWVKFNLFTPSNDVEVLNEYIFNSNLFLCENKVLKPNSFGLANTNDNYDIKLIDLLDSATGKTLDIATLNQKMNWNLNFFQYIRIKSFISVPWIEDLLILPIVTGKKLPNEVYIKVNSKLKAIVKVKTVEIYQELITRVSRPPTSTAIWVNLFPFLEKHEWSVSFELPYKILREPYFQSFQYKILHRIVNCGDNLFKWNIIDSPKCHYCTLIDTIEHHFYYCEVSQAFWENLEMKLKDIYDTELKLSICDILLGLNLENSSLSHCINTVIIWGKWYINKNKNLHNSVYIIDFLKIIKSKLQILEKVYSKEKKIKKFNKIY